MKKTRYTGNVHYKVLANEYKKVFTYRGGR